MISAVENRRAVDESRLRKIEFRAMSSHMMAAVESDDPAAAELLSQVPQRFVGWEQTLSRFKDDSELSLLNRAGGQPIAVSETLWNVLQMALTAARSTGGLVNPAVLNALEAAGYDATFDEIKVRKDTGTDDPREFASSSTGDRQQPATGAPQPTTINPQPSTTSWQSIKTYSRTRSVKLPHGVRLDFGGIGKGWAADEAVKLLAQYGPALVDAGGDIAVSGPADRSVDWPVGVDAPSASVQTGPTALADLLELLAISSGGLATSGIDYRRWQQGGQWRHHIIDPRTGLPAQTGVLTVTMIAPTACAAEIAAKAVLLLGSEEGLAWLDSRPTLAGLLVLEDGSILRSRRFDNYVWSNS
jgi:thiamine biosynthesis lipoprotein